MRRMPNARATRVGLGLVAACLTAAALAACATSPPASPGQPPSGQTAQPTAKPAVTQAARRLADSVIVGRQVAPRSVDPHSNTTVSHFIEPRQIYDALVAFDDEGKQIVPQLATAWSRIDPLTTEFKLRSGVKFSNGDDFTAATVKANVDRVMDTRNASITGQLRGRLLPIASAEVVDPLTVRVKTATPDAYLLNRITMLFMTSEKLIAAGVDLNQQPVGTGSYRVTEFRELSHINFEAFEGTWRGPTPVKKARLQGIPEQAALIGALQTGEIDVAFEANPERALQLENQFNRAVVRNDAVSLMAIRTQNPALQDRRVRQALNYAVDKAGILRSINAGVGRLSEGQLIDSTIEGYNEAVKAYPYDPARARQLLQEAGHSNLTITLETASTIRQQAEAVLGNLRDVGVTVRLEALEPTVFIGRLQGTTTADVFHYQAHYWHLRNFNAAAFNFARPNNPFWGDPRFVQMFQTVDTDLDQARRTQTIKDMIKLMHEEAGAIFLYYDDISVLFTRKIARLPISYDRSIHFWKIEKEA